METLLILNVVVMSIIVATKDVDTASDAIEYIILTFLVIGNMWAIGGLHG